MENSKPISPLIFLVVLTRSATCFSAPDKVITNGSETKEVRNVEMIISSRKSTFFIGEPLFVDIVVKNNDKKPLFSFYDWKYGFLPYDFKIYDEKGKAFPLTEFGKKYVSLTEGDYYFKHRPTANPVAPDVYSGAVGKDRVIISRFIDLSAVDFLKSSKTKIYIEFSRYGKKSNRMPLTIINKDFDSDDPTVLRAIKTGKYQ